MVHYYFLLAVLGLLIGSFINVVIFRFDPEIKQKLGTPWKGRSHCLHCGKVLNWFELVPLLSFLVQLGKCRGCRWALSWQYPLVELSGATLGLLAVYLAHNPIQILGLAVVFWIFLGMTGLDLRYQSVEIISVVGAGIIGGLIQYFFGEMAPKDLLLGFVVGAGLLGAIILIWLVCFKQQAMGVGDVYIAGAIGLITGYPGILVALFTAVWLGAIIGVLGMLSKKMTMKARIPFGPFLFLGLIVTLVWGERLVDWYLNFSGL